VRPTRRVRTPRSAPSLSTEPVNGTWAASTCLRPKFKRVVSDYARRMKSAKTTACGAPMGPFPRRTRNCGSVARYARVSQTAAPAKCASADVTISFERASVCSRAIRSPILAATDWRADIERPLSWARPRILSVIGTALCLRAGSVVPQRQRVAKRGSRAFVAEGPGRPPVARSATLRPFVAMAPHARLTGIKVPIVPRGSASHGRLVRLV
jgi:hypothetical protein